MKSLENQALDCLLAGRVADVAVARDWLLLREIARLAAEGPPAAMEMTDPALFERWQAAVIAFQAMGWRHMTSERVDAVMTRRLMSATTDVIEAARAVIDANKSRLEDGDDWYTNWMARRSEADHALDAALKAYDARHAELKAMANQATGG